MTVKIESLDFPNVLKINRLSYTSVILNHMINRADLNMGDIGKKILPLLARCRSIDPQFLAQYCDVFNNITAQLDRYGDLAESCSRSGAYHPQRIACFEQLKTVMHIFEQDEELLTMLKNMHVAGTF